jgi:hypothetical protein
MQMGAAGAGRQWSAEHGGRAAACEERAAAAPARRPVVVPWKKPRLEQRSGSGSGSFTTIVPSFKVRPLLQQEAIDQYSCIIQDRTHPCSSLGS